MRVIFLFLILTLGASASEDALVLGNVPPAPEEGIYDPDQWLTSDARNEMVLNIEIAKNKWQVEIFVVILPSRPEMAGATLAEKITDEWAKGKFWGMVLHIIGDSEAPMFFAGRKDSFGWNEDREKDFLSSLDRYMEDVKSRAMRENDQRLQVQTGMRELSEELGYMGLVMARINKRYENARGANLKSHREEATNRQFYKRLAMVLVPLVLLVSAMLIYLIVKKLRSSKSNYFFPETSFRRRFLAPWSGGGDVVVKFGSRIKEDGSRKG